MTDVLAPPAAGDNQVHGDFLASRAQAAQPPDAFSAAVAAAGVSTAKPATTPVPASQGEAPAPSPVSYPVIPPHSAPDGSGNMTSLSDADYFRFRSGVPAAAILDRTRQAADEMGRAASQPLGPVLSDLGQGAIDAPRQILGGVLDAGNNLSRFADQVIQHADAAGLPDAYVRLFDKDGNWAPQIESAASFRAAQAAGTDDVVQLPTTGGPDSVTGALIRAGTAFLVARKPTLAGAGEGAGLGSGLLASFNAGATATDPNAPRLSNIIDRVAPNFLTDWLKAKPADEPGLLDRLKTGLDYAGMDALFTKLLPLLKGGTEAAKTLGTLKSEMPASGSTAKAPVGGAAKAGAAAPAAAQPAPAAFAGPQEGFTRFYHGGSPYDGTGSRWLTPGQQYAQGYANKTPGAAVQYVDLPNDHPLLEKTFDDTGTDQIAPFAHFDAPEEIAKELKPLPAAAGEKPDFVPPMMALGDPAAPLVTVDSDIAGQADDFKFMISGKHPVRLNLGRIGSGEDIANALEEVSRHIPAQGVQTHDATIALADSLGLTPEALLRGYQGAQLDARETTAMRFLLDSSAGQLVDYAKAATDPRTATPEAQATFVRAFATHRAIQQYAENARAEAGRTLNAWSIMSQTRGDQAKAIRDIVAAANGNGADVQALAEKLAELTPEQAGRMVGDAARSRGGMGMTIFYNALLSNPRTVVKKLASDVGMGLWNLATRYTAEQRGSGAVPAGETAQLAAGYVGAMRDGFRMAGKALREGRSQFHPEAATIEGMGPRVNVLADGAPRTVDPNAPSEGFMQYLRPALPTSWIGAADDFAKFVNYRAELRSLAFRDGMQKQLGDADLATHMARMMDSPDPAMSAQAWSAAQRTTFQTPLSGFPKQLESFVDSMNVPLGSSGYDLPVGRILVPFVKVPANIAAWSYRNTALAKFFPTDAVKSELAAGGASRDLAVARMSLGSAFALAMADLALTHTVTGGGPKDPKLQRAWRAAGNEPYSIRIGDKSYGYSQVEPVGLLTSAIADTFDISRFASEEDREALALSFVLGAGNALLSRTYLSGVGNFFEALNNPDSDGERWAEALVNSMAAPAGVAAMGQAIDPWVRAHYGMLDSVEKRLPFLSENLPPARTLWGDPIAAREGYMPLASGSVAANILSPVSVRGDAAEPIDKWIWENRQAFPRGADNRLGIQKLSRFQNFERGPGVSAQVELDPGEFDRLQVLAGNDLKDPRNGMGAKDYLNALVGGHSTDTAAQAQWDRAVPAARALMVQKVINRYRAAARRELLTEKPDVADAVTAGLGARRDQLTGAPAAAPAAGAPASPVMPQIGGQ